MDNVDNPVQQQTPFIQNPNVQNFSENPPVSNVSNIKQKVSFPLIIGIVVIMVFVAGGVYYLETKQNKSFTRPTVTQSIQPTEFQLSPTIVPSATLEQFQSVSPQMTGNQVYHSQEYGFSIDIPNGWNYDNRTGRGGKEGTAWLAVKLYRNYNNETITIPIYVDEKNWVSYKPELLKEFSPDRIEETTFADQPALRIVKESQYYYWIKHPKDANKILLGQATFIGPPVYVKSDQKNNNKNDGTGTSIFEYFQTSVDAILNSIKFD